MSRALAQQVADAVLYEGYVLYPYRASAAKNRFRWQVGLVMPRAYAEAAGSDPWFIQTECLVEMEGSATLTVHARALHIQERSIEASADEAAGPVWRSVPQMQVGERQLIAWDEAVACDVTRQIALETQPVRQCFEWALHESDDHELVADPEGRPAARVVRHRRRVDARLVVAAAPCGPFTKIQVRIENLTPTSERALDRREAALRESLAGTHALLSIDRGAFVSLLEPPGGAEALVPECRNVNCFPVLVGSRSARQTVLVSPVILYDYPEVARESPAELCDATEIDELLTLRVRTLTETEKREAKATDPRAAQIVEQCDGASPAVLSRLHGAVRHFGDAPGRAWVEIDGHRVQRGSKVRLNPTRTADSMDLCLRGREAIVDTVYRTLEDEPYISVIVLDDPAGLAGSRYRRSLFFRPDELIPAGEGR